MRAVPLTASCLAISLVLIDTTLVNVALPAIRDDLGADVAELQWIVNAYTLVLASVLMSAGSLADRVGARRLLLVGVGIFAAGSLGAVAAPTVGALVAAQAVMGAAAALLVPCSVAVLTHAYPEPARRARAIGIWAAVSAAAFAASPALGGVATELGGWRAVFAINLPLIVATATLVALGVRETPRRATRGLDLPGQAAAIIALGSLTFAIIESGSRGWSSTVVLAGLGVAVVAGAAFLTVERRSRAPMLPLSLFSSPALSASVAAGALANFAFYGQLFVLSLYLQEARGLSATEMGLAFMPQPVVAMAIGIPIGRVIGRIGSGIPLALGGVAGGVGALILAFVGDATPYGLIAAALMLFGVAAGVVTPAITTAVVAAAPSAQVGIASSALNAGRQTGAVMGVAVLGSLVSGDDVLSAMGPAMAFCTVALAGVVLLGALIRGVRPAAGVG